LRVEFGTGFLSPETDAPKKECSCPTCGQQVREGSDLLGRARPYEAHWVKIKNRKHPAMSRVME
jgi:hypothetical protein